MTIRASSLISLRMINSLVDAEQKPRPRILWKQKRLCIYRSLWRPPPSPPFSRGPKNALWSSMRPPCKVFWWKSKRNYYHCDEVSYTALMHTSWMYKPGVCRSARRSPRQALWALVEAPVPPSPPLPPHLHTEVTILNVSPYFEVTIFNLSPYSATCLKSHQLAKSSFGPQYACPAICSVYTHLYDVLKLQRRIILSNHLHLHQLLEERVIGKRVLVRCGDWQPLQNLRLRKKDKRWESWSQGEIISPPPVCSLSGREEPPKERAARSSGSIGRQLSGREALLSPEN